MSHQVYNSYRTGTQNYQILGLQRVVLREMRHMSLHVSWEPMAMLLQNILLQVRSMKVMLF